MHPRKLPAILVALCALLPAFARAEGGGQSPNPAPVGARRSVGEILRQTERDLRAAEARPRPGGTPVLRSGVRPSAPRGTSELDQLKVKLCALARLDAPTAMRRLNELAAHLTGVRTPEGRVVGHVFSVLNAELGITRAQLRTLPNLAPRMNADDAQDPALRHASRIVVPAGTRALATPDEKMVALIQANAGEHLFFPPIAQGGHRLRAYRMGEEGARTLACVTLGFPDGGRNRKPTLDFARYDFFGILDLVDEPQVSCLALDKRTLEVIPVGKREINLVDVGESAFPAAVVRRARDADTFEALEGTLLLFEGAARLPIGAE